MCKWEKTMTRPDLQSIANCRAAHDKRERATSCKLLMPQIAIDCKYPGGLPNLIPDQREEDYRPKMPPSGFEGEILGGMNS